MGDHRANVEDIADVVEYIRNVDPEQFANIRDEVLEEIDVDFEDIMDQDSDEEVLSDNIGYVSDLSEHDTDHTEKFVSLQKSARGEIHGTVIRVSDWSLLARQKVYPQLRDKCYENDEYKKRHWWNRNVNVIKDGYYWAKKIADKSQGWCICIKIPAGSEKCVKLC